MAERTELLRGGWVASKACVPSVGQQRLDREEEERGGGPTSTSFISFICQSSKKAGADLT